MSRPRALLSWSSGKDSAYAYTACRARDDLEIVGLLTTMGAEYARVSHHGVREALLDRQAAALGLPVWKVPIRSDETCEGYERLMGETMAAARRDGITHVIFGDLYLQRLRDWREARMAEVGMTCVFPLWHRDTRELAQTMVREGLRAVVSCVDTRKLDRSFSGRRFDGDFLAALPPEVDPCGENGEFHTFVTAGPMFATPIEVRTGEIHEANGLVFTDILPA